MSLQQPFGLLMKCGSVALLLASASPAFAAAGDHIRSGSLVVTPKLGVGLQYRSNAFRTQAEPAATGLGTLTPGVDAVADTPDVNFRLGGSYTLQKYAFLTNNGSPDERAERISSLDRFNTFAVNANLDILPSGPVGLYVKDRIGLQNNPSDIDIDSDDPYSTQFRNELSAGLSIRPGPALEFQPGFRYGWTQFFVPDEDAQRDPFNTRNAYTGVLRATWSFLPRTNFVFNSEYTVNRWSDSLVDINGAALAVNDSGLGRVDAGIQGRLTERLRLIARVGSGFGSFSDDSRLDAVHGLLAALQADYKVAESHSVSAGVRKSFFDSFFSNSVSVVSLQGAWTGRYGESFTSMLNIGTRFEDYDGPTDRRDQVTKLGLGLGYDINDWSNLRLNGGWLQRRSPSSPGSEYDDVNLGLQANFQY